jgi:hypothetical protein
VMIAALAPAARTRLRARTRTARADFIAARLIEAQVPKRW